MVDVFKIGVISDTHGQQLPVGVDEAFRGCDHIIHAGDIGNASLMQGQFILDELETIAPVTAVQGNSWSDREGCYRTSTGAVKRNAQLLMGGVYFIVAHIPADIPVLRRMAAGRGIATREQAIIYIHGHTHIPKVVHTHTTAQTSGFTTVCPGAISNPRGGSAVSVAVITVSDGKVLDISLSELI